MAARQQRPHPLHQEPKRILRDLESSAQTVSHPVSHEPPKRQSSMVFLPMEQEIRAFLLSSERAAKPQTARTEAKPKTMAEFKQQQSQHARGTTHSPTNNHAKPSFKSQSKSPQQSQPFKSQQSQPADDEDGSDEDQSFSLDQMMTAAADDDEEETNHPLERSYQMPPPNPDLAEGEQVFYKDNDANDNYHEDDDDKMD